MVNTTSQEGVGAYEFVIDYANPPLVYQADEAVSIFQSAGFVVWLRWFGEHFRLMAIPMVDGVLESSWGGYVESYWISDDSLPDDSYIFPVRKKLPCKWVVEKGFVSQETLPVMFADLDWHMPDYGKEGQKYLASSCSGTYDMALTIKDYAGRSATGDGSMMCGPLALAITNDASSFPYRVGYWYKNPHSFVGTNPRWNAQPWSYFPPDTFDLQMIAISMNGFDFERYGHLYPGDVVYTYSEMYHKAGSPAFNHLFVVTEVKDGSRYSVSNLVKTNDCSIEEIRLYTPGDRYTGFVNKEWHGEYGKTGYSGFDIFRWKWITFHLDGKDIDYIVRFGDTIETIAFD